MRHPIRALTLFLALFAFSASVAEGVWASTCAAMEMQANMPGGMDMPMAGMGDDHTPDMPNRHSDRSDGPDCPLPTLAAGCLVFSFPAPNVHVVLSAPEGGTTASPPAELIDRIAVSSLFHPPQQ